MAGRRLQPQPGAAPSVTEILDPSLAQPMSHGSPVGSPPMMPPMRPQAVAAAAGAASLGAAQFPGAPAQPGTVYAQQDQAGQDLPLPGQQRRPPQQMPQSIDGGDQPFAAFHPEGESVDNPPEETPLEEEVTTELTAAERAKFAMLMHVGKVTKKIDVYTHPVVIESLSVGDDQRIGMYCLDYTGNQLAESRSYQIAVCAAGIRYIDDQPLYQAISGEESEDEIFAKKVKKLQGFYAPVITEIYRAIRNLDLEFAELAEKLKNHKG